MFNKDIIIDGKKVNINRDMIDWVRVIDKNNTVVYANNKMLEDLGHDIVGKKCYHIIGKQEKCVGCISERTIITGDNLSKEQIINNKVYNAMSSPVKNDEGEIVATVEVFRDITKEKELSKNLEEKNIKMSNDIEFAKNMQKRMLPLPGIYNDLIISSFYKPSEMLSGDIFDVYKIDYEHTGIYVCDVVGHGVTASLLTIFVRQSLRTISKNKTDINKIIKELHKTFLALNLNADKYFSVFFGIYNKSTKEFKYINAGHNAIPILLSNGQTTMLKAKGYPICNIFDTVNYEINTVKLKKKDKLILYTDGIVEARDKNGNEFGLEKFINIIKKEEEIIKQVEKELEEHTDNQIDDYTMLIIDVM